MDPKDLDYLVRTVFGEARGEQPVGQQAVASVILNRAKAGGQSVGDVVQAPHQFTPWGDPTTRARITGLDAGSPEYQRIAANIQPALDGQDPTGGADHFYAPKLASPAWGGQGQDIGNHRFMKIGYAGSGKGQGGAMPNPSDLKSYFAGAAASASGQASDGPPSSGDLKAFYGLHDAPVAAPAPAKAPVTAGGLIKSLVTGVGQGFAPLADAALDAGPLGLLKRAADATGMWQGRLTPQIQPGVSPVTAKVAQVGRAPQNVPEEYARTIGQMTPNVIAPGASLPAKVASVIAPALTSETAGQVARASGAGQTAESIARLAGGLGGSGLASLRTNPRQATAPAATPSVADLKLAKTKAYQAVDNAGVAFKPAPVKALSNDISMMIEDEGGADLYPKAAAMAKRIDNVVNKGDVTLSRIDKLRSQVGEKLMSGSDQEARLGAMIREKLDGFIDGAQPEDLSSGITTDATGLLKTARDLNSRYRKVQEVTDRLDSAGLQADATYSGGNLNNATRQKLKPLIDPKSPQRLRNLSPLEDAALQTSVRGTPAGNGLRFTGKLLDNRLVQVMAAALAPGTYGASLALPALGFAARKGGDAAERKSVEQLLAILANGGPTAARAAPGPLRLGVSGAGLALPGMAMALSASPSNAQTKKRSSSH